MRAIILAAGQGTRLRPLTDDKPKCMVKVKGKPIIDYTLDNLSACGISDINLISGYKYEVLHDYCKKRVSDFFINTNYKTTNMVHSLFCAEKIFNDDLIISYSDIIYSKKNLNKLIKSKYPISVIVDLDWRKLWSKRMSDPLTDAETLKLDSKNNILELGKKPKNYDEIEGQYIGLIKISKTVTEKIKDFYQNLDKNDLYDSKDFPNMYMTSFIQLIIDRLMPVKAVLVRGEWMEFDTIADIKSYEVE